MVVLSEGVFIVFYITSEKEKKHKKVFDVKAFLYTTRENENLFCIFCFILFL